MSVREAAGEDSPVVSRWRHYCKVAVYLVAIGVITLAGTGSAEPVTNRLDKVAFGVYAEDAAIPNADLTKTVTDPAVVAELDQPDGVAIKMKDDGSFQIFARGTGTYDFNDVDEINDARKEAVFKAKAALAKFMNEKLSTEEGFAEASKKTKSITNDGQNQSVNVSKESVKTSATLIKNSAYAHLKEVITLKTVKIARGEGGEVQATVGVSSKSLERSLMISSSYNMGGRPILPKMFLIRSDYGMGGEPMVPGSTHGTLGTIKSGFSIEDDDL